MRTSLMYGETVLKADDDDAATFLEKAAEAARLGCLTEAIKFANLGSSFLLRTVAAQQEEPTVTWPKQNVMN